MEIRKATAADAGEILTLNTAFGYDYPPEATAEKLQMLADREDLCILLAIEDGHTVGYIHLCDYDTLYFPHMKNVLGVIVLPEYRRRGVASRLLAAGEAWARETGAAGIRLDSGAERTPAHECYQKAGFTERKLHKYFVKLF